MKPHYEQYRANGQAARVRGFRCPDDLYARIEQLAQLEGDSVAGLVIEGLARIVEDRLSPEHIAEIRAGAEAHIATLQMMAEQAQLPLANEPATPVVKQIAGWGAVGEP